MNPSDLPSILASYDFNFTSEAELQHAIDQVLGLEGFTFLREVKLSDTDRIDFLIQDGQSDLEKSGAGVEVKTRFGNNDVLRQLHRYAGHDRISELFLVTTKTLHAIPDEISGKRVTTIQLGVSHSL